MSLVSIWLGSAGCIPEHLFGLVSPGFLDVTHTEGGNDAMVEERGLRELKTKPSLWLVVWTEAKARTEGGREKEIEREGGREGGTERRRRGLSSSLLSTRWRGQEAAKSVGHLSTCSQHVCGYPSVYLSVPICVHLSVCLVCNYIVHVFRRRT